MALEAVLALVALATAAEVVRVLRYHLPTTLRASTDIIGYPTFHAFDGEQYLETFYLVVLLGPLLATCLFLLLSGSATLAGIPQPRRGPLLPRSRSAPLRPATAPLPSATRGVVARAWAVANGACRLGAVGAILGVELAIRRGRVGGHFWVNVAEGLVVYTVAVAVVLAAAIAIGRRRWTVPVPALLALVNALGACGCVAGLAAVSSVTSVTTLDDHVVHPYSWFSPWLAAIVVLGLVSAVLAAVRIQELEPERTRLIERRAILLVAVPVLVFLGIGRFPGTIGPFLLFEDGQQMATLRMLQSGMLPWRDYIGAHGLLEDTLRHVPGLALFGQTYWGALAGYALIVLPTAFIAIYLLAYRVFGSMTLALLAVATYFFHNSAIVTYTRFMFWPLILVLVLICLDRRSRMMAGIVAVTLVAYNLIAPETAYCVAATGLAFVCRDAYSARWRRGALLRSFELTLWYAGGVALAALASLAVLAAFHGLDGLILYYTTNISGHNLEGLVPIQPMEPPFRTWAYAPAVGVVLGLGIIAVKLRLRRTLCSRDFAMIATVVVTVLYYEKFTDRADLHVLQAYAVAVPLFLFVARELMDVGEAVVKVVTRRVVRFNPVAFPTGVVALGVAIVTAPTALTSLAASTSEHFRPVAVQEPWQPSLGYSARQDEQLFQDMRAVLALYMKPGDHVFDFTNEPGLLYWIEDLLPSTRYYMVNIAMPQAAQDEVVRELQLERPKYMVYFGSGYDTLPVWDDISNAVRHYDVSQYILDHYHPLLSIDTQILYVANGATDVPDPGLLRGRVQGQVYTDDLAFRGFPCAWGYSPEYLNIAHPPESEAVAVGGELSGTSLTLRPPIGHAWADYHWIEVRASAGRFASDTFTLSLGSSVTGEDRAITFQSLEGSTKVYRFPIGACSQWHGFQSSAIQLSHLASQGVTISLLP